MASCCCCCLLLPPYPLAPHHTACLCLCWNQFSKQLNLPRGSGAGRQVCSILRLSNWRWPISELIATTAEMQHAASCVANLPLAAASFCCCFPQSCRFHCSRVVYQLHSWERKRGREAEREGRSCVLVTMPWPASCHSCHTQVPPCRWT